MRQKILFVSHCFLNDAAKLKHQNLEAQQSERISKRAFLKQILDREMMQEASESEDLGYEMEENS